MTSVIEFGAFVPQGWRLDLVGIDPAAQWNALSGVAKRLDDGAWDSLWVYDHMHTVPAPVKESTFEAWSVMAALASSTSRIRLGQMCTSIGYRNPAFLAKIAATVDLISNGRLDFGIGAGWYEHEWRAYGYGFPGTGDRLAALAEGVQIIQRMWSEGSATLEGKHFSVEGALCVPQPLQRGRDDLPHIPTWIAGAGEQRTLKYAARWADVTNFGGSAEHFTRKREILLEHCERVGRDPATLRHSTNVNVIVRETESEAKAEYERVLERTNAVLPGASQNAAFSSASAIIGTPEQVAAQLLPLRDAGASIFIAYMPDVAYTHDGIDAFESAVMPLVREASPLR
ncbi:LLM class F420-dependent oxidoreductase [Humidisolicoccus flavus]|uniref:LLM class F420-dependent oxidoreductase n=1 Tax=Humidisolicoccus flavus TaxID=3111414 RepID=UPI003247A94C